ncbi:MAG: DEAD/DEAH box helicase, partial [Desulfobulbaceae bacterium]|nr:DEAD/DEAH box helicase [Desulfobulbaceae bacterium]
MTNKITYPEDLPITGSKDEIIAAILEHPVVIIAGETGSGKTTQLPKMCLEAGLGKKRLIGCTQPRRLAAVSIAARVASELGKKNRHLIGYKIRFKDRTTGSTKIKFMTDGILLAEAQMDRSLRAYDTVIVDEAHERNLNIDFLLGIFKQLLWRRKDLKLIITSATIDTEKFSKKFDNAPVIEVCGRTYPIDVVYRHIPEKNDPDIDESYVDEAINAVLDIMKTDHVGDILIFMPTERDILETVEGITNSLKGLSVHSASQNLKNTLIIPLFGRQSGHEQNRIYRPFKGQKIVVATNVAETSITVPGIRYVVDTGLARISIYNVRARTSKLPIRPISRAACDQRKGRCGRVG